MVNLLYAVAAFTCALVVLILPARTRRNLSKGQPIDRAFLRLIDWTVIFCCADGTWGLVASDLIMNDHILFAASVIFHSFAAFTPLVWLYFVITYVGKIRFRWYYFHISLILFLAEMVLVFTNFWDRQVFFVNADGEYQTGPLRRYLFYAQYLNYVTIAILAFFRTVRNDSRNSNYLAVLAFVAAPLGAGVFQLLYPDAPAYSIGYMLGCCIIYSFVVTDIINARTMENISMSRANEAKTAFLNSMSHDIRTPLNAITGFNNVALGALGKDDGKVKDCLKKIAQSSDALLTIINDILEISRIEAGKIIFSEDKGNVRYSFVNIDSMMQEIARTSGIRLSFSFGKIEDLYVICDFAHCGRVFTNLISNAIKYTPRGGSVDVHCEQTGRRSDGYGLYTYTFKDNGIGMSDEFQKQLFQPFSRERTSTVSKIQGTGLGLALSKNLVESMGGTISCESRQGKGSTFTVTLPFRIQEGQEYVVPQTNPNDMEFLRDRKILLVEDNELNREIANAILGEIGAHVTDAEDGSQAVEMMKSPEADDYDLVLMDIQMPTMDGIEATRQIRALGTKASRIPIVAMSANAFEEDRQRAFAAGMNGYITKPVDLSILTSTLKKYLI